MILAITRCSCSQGCCSLSVLCAFNSTFCDKKLGAKLSAFRLIAYSAYAIHSIHSTTCRGGVSLLGLQSLANDFAKNCSCTKEARPVTPTFLVITIFIELRELNKILNEFYFLKENEYTGTSKKWDENKRWRAYISPADFNCLQCERIITLIIILSLTQKEHFASRREHTNSPH